MATACSRRFCGGFSEGSANAKETKILFSELGSMIFPDAAISMEAGFFETL
jgi:hypothetical protein